MRRLGLLMGSVWFKLWRAAALPVQLIRRLPLLLTQTGPSSLTFT